ncbi:MAG TPA: BlaI/MecI/CopY family transcriptional regulator [Clostridiales bacterium]|jgi:predicted transcriptional regulator|nr:BlaI/MecI/CopY family transcriptional regulator [Clostridiales bacterium]
MEKYKLGEMEQKFADLIWEKEPIKSGELAELCVHAFDWKRTTTYTMLKRLCDRQIFKNDNGTVVALMSKEDFLSGQGHVFIEETFGGSLPKFLTTFTRRKKLNSKEIEEIQRMIDEFKES